MISGAEAALVALADRVGALLATSVCGHGLFSGNPWSVGISGGFSSPVADELISESDFILAFGASLTQWTTKKGKLIAPGAVVAQVDIEVAKARLSDAGHVSPCRATPKRRRKRLLVELDRRDVKARASRRNDAMRDRIVAGDNHHFPHAEESSARIHRSARAEQGGRCYFADGPRGGVGLRTFLRLGAAILAGTECARLVPEPFLPVSRPRPAFDNRSRYRQSRQARGAWHRRRWFPDVDCRFGNRDPSRLRLCILVYNDASYAAEVHYFGRQGFSTDIVKFPDTDFAAIARGYGARGATVRTLADLEPVKAWVAEGAPGVFVIDGKINPESRSRLARRAFSQGQPLNIATDRSRRQVVQHAPLDRGSHQK